MPSIVKKIKTYALLSFLMPLLTINFTLLSYKLLSDYDVSPKINWDQKEINIPYEEKFFEYRDNLQNYAISPVLKKNGSSFTDCPKFKVEIYESFGNKLILHSDNNETLIREIRDNNKSNGIIYKQNKIINERCIKNNKFYHFVLSNLSFLERVLIDTSINTKTGFAEIENPYLYGEVSISRTARFFPNTLIFKPLIILSAFFLFSYWRNNLKVFQSIGSSSKYFFYFGALSCIFLTLHAIFLGVDLNSKVFTSFRRLIIILFIIFEIAAQFILTKNIYSNKEKLEKIIRRSVLNIKIYFVLIVFVITSTCAYFLGFTDMGRSFQNIVEWNYFAFLLFFYFLSFCLWKIKF